MSSPAKDGKLLIEIVAIAAKICQSAEADNPVSRVGRPPEVPYWVLGTMILVGVLLRKRSKTSQYAWWVSHKIQYDQWFPGIAFPGRSTFFERYPKAAKLFEAAIDRHAKVAVAKGWLDTKCVSVDKSLLVARGRKPPFKSSPGRPTKKIDKQASWGYSKHHGWVYGYSFEVVLSSSKNKANWPILASADIASKSEHVTLKEKVARLPPQTRYVLADAGYDSNSTAELVEDSLPRECRRFICPEVPRHNNGKPRKPTSRQCKTRQYHRKRRDDRRKFYRSTKGKLLYARRKTTIEPFNNHLKELFDLHHRCWHFGLENNRTQVLAAVFGYQVLLHVNHKRGRRNACIKWILDRL